MYVIDLYGEIRQLNTSHYHSSEDFHIHHHLIVYGVQYTYEQYPLVLEQIKQKNIQYLSLKDASISNNHSICKIKYI